VIIARMRAGEGTLGFDAARKEWVDLVVSVASVLLLTEATMVQIAEEKAPREQPEFA
jgi:chaperonin GroEL